MLLPEAVYTMLMDQAKAPKVSAATLEETASPRRGKKNDKIIFLRVLRPIHLGDIKTQINPDEVLEWIPHKSITIRGKTHTELGSFLAAWNKQDVHSPTYLRSYQPVFEIDEGSIDDYNDLYAGRPASNRKGRLTEQERIAMEESPRPAPTRARKTHQVADGFRVAAPPQPSQADLDDLEEDYNVRQGQLPPRGSEERKAMIVDALEGGNRKDRDSDPMDLSVDDMALSQTPASYRTVGRVPGAPADEGRRQPKMRRR